MELSPRLSKIKPSSTLKISALAKQLKAEGKPVIDFSVGEPDFDTPPSVKRATIEAIERGFTKYTAPSGIPELKAAIAEKLKRENDLVYLPRQIIVTSGAKQALFTVLFALLEESDEVLITAPYWVSYPEIVQLAGGLPRIIYTSYENGFKLTPQLLTKHISKKTKVLVLNYPSNPAGVMYAPEELAALAAVVEQYPCTVLSDEIYEKILFDARVFASFATLKNMYDRTITVNGVSKSFSMTGFRIGYIAAPEPVAEACETIQSQTTSCAVSFAQKGAAAAFGLNADWFNYVKDIFQRRRERIVSGLKTIPGVSALKPDGAFYVFCNVAQTGMDGNEFAERLLRDAQVASVPGDGFGYRDFVRFSFAVSEEQIEEGIQRIRKFVKAHI